MRSQKDNPKLLDIEKLPKEYQNIPSDTLLAIKRYVEEAGYVGGFIAAVLNNDLRGAIANADNDNLANLPHIVRFLYNHCPMDCHKEGWKGTLNTPDI